MKYRYILVAYGHRFTRTNKITRDDLIRKKNGDLDAIINVEDYSYFDAETNSWVAIETVDTLESEL